MPTNGQKVIEKALEYEGWHESGVNSGQPLERWQQRAAFVHGLPPNGYVRAPWCAIFVKQMFHEARVDIHERLTHPYTGYI